MKNPASKLTRIRLELEEYDFTIIHIKGKDNVVADALSRITLNDIKTPFEASEAVLAITRSQTRKLNSDKNKINTVQWPMNDTIFKVITINEFKNMGNEVLKKLTIHLISKAISINDKNEKKEIIDRYHNDPLYGGHLGIKKMYSKIRSKYYWKNMLKDITNYVINSEKCNVSKHRTHTKVPMIITGTPQKPFDVMIIDTIGPLPKSENGNAYAVTMVCDMTKYLVTSAIPDKSAKTIAKAIFNDFILIYSPMKEIRTDHGTEYINETISELCKLTKVNHRHSTSYRHETVGSIERNHAFFNTVHKVIY